MDKNRKSRSALSLAKPKPLQTKKNKTSDRSILGVLKSTTSANQKKQKFRMLHTRSCEKNKTTCPHFRPEFCLLRNRGFLSSGSRSDIYNWPVVNHAPYYVVPVRTHPRTPSFRPTGHLLAPAEPASNPGALLHPAQQARSFPKLRTIKIKSKFLEPVTVSVIRIRTYFPLSC